MQGSLGFPVKGFQIGGTTTAIPKEPMQLPIKANDRFLSQTGVIILLRKKAPMNLIQRILQRLEMRLQALIEGSTRRIFPAHPFRHELAQQLVEAMHTEIHRNGDGNLQAPNIFTIFLPEAQAQVFENQPELLDELVECLRRAGQEAQVNFTAEPVVKVIRNPEPDVEEAQIVAQFSLAMDEETSTVEFPSLFRLAKARLFRHS